MTDSLITIQRQPTIVSSMIYRLWISGFDTMAIALVANVPESYVYNLLAARPVRKRGAS